MSKINVLIVEDSILMQKMICDVLASDPEIEIVARAHSGKEALEKIKEFKPDVVTLDIHLPDMSGITVLQEIMKENPTRVIMFSAYTEKGADITMKALELGALDFIPKPSGEISLDLHEFKDEIISKIKNVSGVDIDKYRSNVEQFPSLGEMLGIKKIVVIAASTGGPRAVVSVMQKIESKFAASFLIVQHMPQGFTKSFAERISWHSQLRVKEAEDMDLVLKGAGYVAPSGYHMVLTKTDKGDNQYCLRLDETPLVNYVRPSADVTMKSVADIFGKDVVGVVLTGMGKDGLEGARHIKNKGGVIITQDEESSVIYGMPKVVNEAGLADSVVGLDKISNEITKYLN